MDTVAERLLGDAFIAASWGTYVAVFLVLWAPHLPPFVVGLAIVLAVGVGHWVGITWKRHVVGRTPVAAAWLAITD